MEKRNRTRKRSKNVDAKMAAANDNSIAAAEAPVLELASAVVEREAATPVKIATAQAQATATGAGYAKLAGRPSKQAVTAVFGSTGYAKSWVQRAVILGITPEELCEQFVKDPDGLKVRYAAATAKKSA